MHKQSDSDEDNNNNHYHIFSAEKLKLNQVPELLGINYDPDDDGFEFGILMAFAVTKRINLFNMIRKTILSNNAKIFEQALLELNKRLQSDLETKKIKLPSDWSNEKSDRGLLMGVSEKGI